MTIDRSEYSIQDGIELIAGISPRKISEIDFMAVRSGYDLCMHFLWIEEKMHMLLENYYEWENELVNAYDRILALKDTSNCIAVGDDQIIDFNRRLNNLLSSVRLYQDHIYSALSNIDKKHKTSFEKDMKKYSNDLYDESVEYQLLELFRNYMQHQGLAIERITIIEPMFQSKIEYMLILVESSIERISKIEKYNQKIKDKELFELGFKWINIIPMVRKYINQIIKFHCKYQELSKEIMENAFSQISCVLDGEYQNEMHPKIAFYGKNVKEDFLLQIGFVEKVKSIRSIQKEIDVEKYAIKKKTCIFEEAVSNFSRINVRYNMGI